MRTISFNIQVNETGMAHNIPPVKSYSLQDYKDLFNISKASADQIKIDAFKLQNRPVQQWLDSGQKCTECKNLSFFYFHPSMDIFGSFKII